MVVKLCGESNRVSPSSVTQVTGILFFVIAHLRKNKTRYTVEVGRSMYYAFHIMCGYNTVFFPMKHRLADTPAANAAVAWLVLTFHFLFAVLLIKPFKHGPVEDVKVTKPSVAVVLAVAVPFFAVPIAWFVACDL